MENENSESNNDADNNFHHISMWAPTKSASERKPTTKLPHQNEIKWKAILFAFQSDCRWLRDACLTVLLFDCYKVHNTLNYWFCSPFSQLLIAAQTHTSTSTSTRTYWSCHYHCQKRSISHAESESEREKLMYHSNTKNAHTIESVYDK